MLCPLLWYFPSLRGVSFARKSYRKCFSFTPPCLRCLPSVMGIWLLARVSWSGSPFQVDNREYFKARVPDLWDLIPDDLRWSWCNNNWNKVHNRCNTLNHPQTIPSTPTPRPADPSPWKNCLPSNWFLVPKSLETAVLKYSATLRGSF